MRKKYSIEVDCANCAAKIEDAIKKIDGVNDCSIAFMTQKIMLDVDDLKSDEILKEAQKVCASVDSDSRIILK